MDLYFVVKVITFMVSYVNVTFVRWGSDRLYENLHNKAAFVFSDEFIPVIEFETAVNHKFSTKITFLNQTTQGL